jgi:excisionase family DNA binding protein
MSRLLTPDEVAERLRVPRATLSQWRYLRSGPPAIRVGRHLRYPEDGFEAWLKQLAEAERTAAR